MKICFSGRFMVDLWKSNFLTMFQCLLQVLVVNNSMFLLYVRVVGLNLIYTVFKLNFLVLSMFFLKLNSGNL